MKGGRPFSRPAHVDPQSVIEDEVGRQGPLTVVAPRTAKPWRDFAGNVQETGQVKNVPRP